MESLDALVVDRPGPALSPDALRALCERARAARVAVIGLRRDGEEPRLGGPRADVETGNPGSTGELTTAPAVDIGLFNPDLFTPDGVAGYMAALDDDAYVTELDDSFPMLRAATRFDLGHAAHVRRVDRRAAPRGSSRAATWSPTRSCSRSSTGASASSTTPRSTPLSSSGRAGSQSSRGRGPGLRGGDLGRARGDAGRRVAELLEPLRPATSPIRDRRERASVALRRAALREHSAGPAGARSRPPRGFGSRRGRRSR